MTTRHEIPTHLEMDVRTPIAAICMVGVQFAEGFSLIQAETAQKAVAYKRLIGFGNETTLKSTYKIMEALIIPTLGSMIVVGGSSLGLILLIIIIVLLVR